MVHVLDLLQINWAANLQTCCLVHVAALTALQRLAVYTM
jgi:hypothetical protein